MPAWLSFALQILGGLSVLSGVALFFLGKGRKQASVGISKTEAEVYKQLVENRLADLNLTEIIEKKVEHEVEKFKDMLWDAQKEHYQVKLELQERQIKLLRERNEIEQENELLKNELHEVREEYKSCLKLIEGLRAEVEKLKKKS